MQLFFYDDDDDHSQPASQPAHANLIGVEVMISVVENYGTIFITIKNFCFRIDNVQFLPFICMFYFCSLLKDIVEHPISIDALNQRNLLSIRIQVNIQIRKMREFQLNQNTLFQSNITQEFQFNQNTHFKSI